MKQLFTLFFSLYTVFSMAQISSLEINSKVLDTKRSISIYTPKNYDTKKQYPLWITLNAELLFEPTVTNSKFYSKLKEMPECIIVGINQEGFEQEDFKYDTNNGLPVDSGISFFEFISLEILPAIESKYSISPFKGIIGHGKGANFINYYLLKEVPLFDAYVTLSPELAPNMISYLKDRFKTQNQNINYYLATSENDLRAHKENIKSLHFALKENKNKKNTYFFEEFEQASHTSIASFAIPKALDHIFSVYKPISPQEYRKDILSYNKPIISYLTNKYENIEKLLGFSKKITVNDIMAIYAATKKKEDLASLLALGELAKKYYPKTMLGHFFTAEYHEKSGEPKKALKNYQKAFILEEIDFLTKDLMVSRIDSLKADFGW